VDRTERIGESGREDRYGERERERRKKRARVFKLFSVPSTSKLPFISLAILVPLVQPVYGEQPVLDIFLREEFSRGLLTYRCGSSREMRGDRRNIKKERTQNGGREGREEREDERSKKNGGYGGGTRAGGGTSLFERPKHLRVVRVGESRPSLRETQRLRREVGARKLEKGI